MKRAGVFCFLSVFLLCVGNARAWDQEQLEIFDLVEEINENFYTVLKVNQVCFDLLELFYAGKCIFRLKNGEFPFESANSLEVMLYNLIHFLLIVSDCTTSSIRFPSAIGCDPSG